jgi:hypothetical protein
VKLLQQDPLAPERPTIVAETSAAAIVLPASLPRSIGQFYRRAAGLVLLLQILT